MRIYYTPGTDPLLRYSPAGLARLYAAILTLFDSLEESATFNAGRFVPLMGAALLAEYEDLLGRESIWRKTRLTAAEREAFLDIFLSICQWRRIYYAWRPNLSDEADNHLMELAVAGQADYLVTRNVRDLRGGELKFPQISVVTPTQLLKEQA